MGVAGFWDCYFLSLLCLLFLSLGGVERSRCFQLKKATMVDLEGPNKSFVAAMDFEELQGFTYVEKRRQKD